MSEVDALAESFAHALRARLIRGPKRRQLLAILQQVYHESQSDSGLSPATFESFKSQLKSPRLRLCSKPSLALGGPFIPPIISRLGWFYEQLEKHQRDFQPSPGATLQSTESQIPNNAAPIVHAID
jgi:hypothetical protein